MPTVIISGSDDLVGLRVVGIDSDMRVESFASAQSEQPVTNELGAQAATSSTGRYPNLAGTRDLMGWSSDLEKLRGGLSGIELALRRCDHPQKAHGPDVEQRVECDAG